MTQSTINTTWMWRYEADVQGATLNLDDHTIDWADTVGCLCGDSDNGYEQTFADFLQRGARFTDPTPEIEAEIRRSIEQAMAVLPLT